VQSKNKRAPNKAESEHITRIKAMRCIVCDATGPSDCHEITQGHWWTSLPLCKDCHQGPHNGIHGQRAIWNVLKLDELGALNLLIPKLVSD
jgi:hypothetical protein